MGISLSLGTGISSGGWGGGGSAGGGTVTPPAPATSEALTLLGRRNGFAIDFVGKRMVINDRNTPGNVFDGNPEDKLTKYGSDSYAYDPQKGLVLDALRDFGVALDTTLFPHNPTAIHVYARYTLNAADSTDQRYIYMVDNAGNDRFAVYTTSGANFRFVTGSGTAADVEVSSTALAADTQYRTFFGADALGRHWVDAGGVQTDDQLHAIQTATPSHVGIGGYTNQVLRVLDGHLAEITVICDEFPAEIRPTQAPPAVLYGAEGDSHTFNVSFGMDEAEFYPARVVATLPTPYASRNTGGSGDSSAEMVGQLGDFLTGGAPDIATIYAGSNDGDVSIADAPAPGASVFNVDAAGRLAVGSWVIVNGESRQITGLNGTEVTLNAALSAAPSITDVVEIDTQKNIEAWVTAVQTAGARRVMVVGSHYLNFASAGDTPTTEQSLRSSVRVKQRAAADALGVEYIDTYAWMRDVILSGAVTQGDWSVWHQGATDTHLTAAGEQVVADAIAAAISAG